MGEKMRSLLETIESSAFYRHGLNRNGHEGTALLVHGLGESSLCFQALLDSPLLSRWALLAPDFPGHGKNTSSKLFGLSEFADLLASWIVSSRPQRLVLVGHSMGGVIGHYVCQRVPQAVAAFVNVEGNLSLEDCASSGPTAAQPEGEFLQSGFDRLLKQVELAGQVDPASASYARSLKLCNRQQFYRNSRELVEVSGAEKLASQLAGSQVRTLYVAGLRGRPETSRSLQLLEEYQIDWLGFRQSAHWPFIDETDRFSRLLNDVFMALSNDLPESE